MAFGLDETGFTLKRLTDIIASMRTTAASIFGTEITTDEDSVFGQLIAVQADEVATLWEGMQEVYDSQKPDSAEGVQLDDVSDLNGVTRLPATSSVVDAVLTGTAATVIPIASIASVNPTNEQFSLLVAVTLDPAAPVGVAVTASGNDATYTITINGTPFIHGPTVAEPASSIVANLKVLVDAGSEPVTFVDNLDGTFQLDAVDQTLVYALLLSAELSAGDVSTPGSFESVNTGPIEAPLGTLIQIDTPVFGWDAVTNPVEAATGSNVETDTALRLRRRQSVSIAGSGTVDAITANVLDIVGVTDAFVVENRTFAVDVDGRPPKSFETVVTGGDDDAIAQEIWNRKPAGIETVGDITVATVTDSQGQSRTIEFSRPEDIWVHLEIDYTLYLEEIFPSNGETAIAEAASDAGNLLGINEDVILQRLQGPIFDAVQGIGTLAIRIATSATAGGPPGAFTAVNLAIGSTEISRFDIARITVAEV